MSDVQMMIHAAAEIAFDQTGRDYDDLLPGEQEYYQQIVYSAGYFED